ncbi:hypothetical protein LL033_17360 [Clostridium estertheticum]|uniref:hypothetical protein n=1 Tax=Clostridium estertheticum TaxID=238834 RepID=UPI001C0D0DE4|nr:hypothetical protein [Clostridium estertheticum]MBU3216662.1 hypothetical protein [Clostridium estertheticum]WAG54382.1 hypothetical protein LL033_17360 [Clostridium estertheticum]
MNIDELNDFCIKNINMELLDMKDHPITVKEVIASALKEIETDESCKDDLESMLKMIESLKEFEDLNCIYSTDCMSGGTFGQGFVIIDSNLDYKGFVRTI